MLNLKQMKVLVEVVEKYNPKANLQFKSWGDGIDDYSQAVVWLSDDLRRGDIKRLEEAGFSVGRKYTQTWIAVGDTWNLRR